MRSLWFISNFANPFLRWWLPLRLRRRLAQLESKFNRNEKVDEFHPHLTIDMEAAYYLTAKERSFYYTQLTRLKERADRQGLGHEVSNYLRGKPGWLSFQRKPLAKKRIRAYGF